MSLSLILLILAFVCFVLATIPVPTGRISTVALGLAFWVLSILIAGGGVALR
jgi:hypothetical protein